MSDVAMKTNVGQFLTRRAALSPNHDGLVDADTGRRFSFREWNLRSNRTANALTGLGIGPGDRVALLVMNSVEYAESFFAIAKLGAICVPLNLRLMPAEVAYILRDAGARTLIFSAELTPIATALHAMGGGDTGTPIERWIGVGLPERPEWVQSYEALHEAAPDTEPEAGASEDDVLYIMYTSGTTGLPKGAVHTHNTATWGVLTIQATSDSRQGDRYLMSLPLFHVGALTPMTANVVGGVTNVVMRMFNPQRAWQLINDEQITIMLKVPAMLNFMLQVYEPGKYKHDQLRFCWSGAAPLPVALIEAYAKLNIPIHQVYGLTETCGPGCLISGEDALRKAGSTGLAFFHTDVRVVDPSGADVAPGESGEVIVRGKHVMREYWNSPEATAETIRDGWLYTGDGATVDEDGYVYIQDRIKDMIISGGENVYPAEVEGVLMQHPGIGDAAVIGQSSARWGESAVAIVVRKDPALDTAGVLAFVSDKLARYKQPVAVEFVDEVPRNPSGKVLKRVLREQFPGPAAE